MNVISTLKQLKIAPEKTLILAVSGGVDSMVMLSLLTGGPFRIVVVHFNHMKRDQSYIEKDLVESYCRNNDIGFHDYQIHVRDGNFHHEAHHLRLHYLKEVAHLYKTPYILTAHHQDDLFENILIKLTRGSNLLGYAGMQLYHQDGKFIYIKPLLYTPKEDIIDYAQKHGVDYLTDESNESSLYLRNRYRHAIIPIMKQENPDLLNQIKRYHHQLTDAFRFIRQETLIHLKNRLEIDLNTYRDLPSALQDDTIAYLIECYDLSLSYETIQKIKRMLLSIKPNKSYALNRNHMFVKAYDKAYIEPLSAKNNQIKELREGINVIDNNDTFTFFLKTNPNTEKFIKLCYNKLAFPLMIRHRFAGDTLTYSYGHKKLKKLLIDKKVPLKHRDNLYVLTDRDGQILWVEGYYINEMLGNENQLLFRLLRG